MAESIQHKLSRVRPPRVQITYDVETGGAIEKKELPFVIGVVADLTGVDEEGPRLDADLTDEERTEKPREKLAPVRERPFVEIDRDNFDQVMADAWPRVKIDVKDVLSGSEASTDAAAKKTDGKDGDGEPANKPSEPRLQATLDFRTFKHFEPHKVVEQVKSLRDLMEARNLLRDLSTKLDGNDELRASLATIIEKDEAALEKLLAAAENASSGSDQGKTAND